MGSTLEVDIVDVLDILSDLKSTYYKFEMFQWEQGIVLYKFVLGIDLIGILFTVDRVINSY